MAITEMQLSRMRKDPFRHRVARGQDEIIRFEVQGFNGRGHQGEKVPVNLFHKRDALQKRLACRIPRELPPLVRGKTVEEHEEIRPGKQTHDFGQNPLRTRPGHEPFMNNRYFHPESDILPVHPEHRSWRFDHSQKYPYIIPISTDKQKPGT